MIPGTAFRAETHSRRRDLLAAAFLAASCLLPALAHAAARFGEVSGSVSFRGSGAPAWTAVSGPGQPLSSGDEVRTGRGSRAVIVFDDGSKVEIGANGSFHLQEAAESSAAMNLSLGHLKAWVTKALSRRFQVRTPTAICAVRGTEFGVDVAENGNTRVAVTQGLVSVGDQQGNEVLVGQGQRVDVTAGGIGQKADGSRGGSDNADKTRLALKREVGLEMTKEEVQAAAALEQKQAVYQQGKAMIDVNGNRVRIEEYIIRPAADQFKLVVLNERVDRFDYFYYTGTFNQALPADLSVALRQIQGQAITAPDYYLKSFETGRSNTQDKVLEQASGGHLVDVNNNTDASDDVAAAFDSRVDGVVKLKIPNPGGTGNDPYWSTLFDNYSLKFNDVVHTAWVPSGGPNVQNYTTAITRTDVVNIVQDPSCVDGDHCTYDPQPGLLQHRIYREDNTGAVWDRFDNYVVSDEGKVASKSDFAGVTAGASFAKLLLNWNYEQVITASEFNGRKIDLVVAPKILIESGLIASTGN